MHSIPVMKVLFIATVVKTHIMEFHIPYLKMFKDMGWETAVAARNDYEDPADCVIPYCDHFYDIPFERNPFKPQNIIACRQLRRIIDSEGYDIIHCHTPVGGVIGRLASAGARRHGSKVFYTAHGFHFFKGSSPVNWILYYPVERLFARLTDVLITINTEDYRTAGKFRAGRVEYTPGIGVDIDKFSAGSRTGAEEKRVELGIPQEAAVLLSVGEVNRNKNHRVVLEALRDIESAWYVLCGSGPLLDDLKRLAAEYGIDDRVIFAGYRTDVADFYNMADIFVFPSYREGLPVALMEAMAAGLVCIASRNRGTDDLLPESRLRFEASNVEELKQRIRTAMTEDCTEEIRRNHEHLKKFDIKNVLKLTRNIYMREISSK